MDLEVKKRFYATLTDTYCQLVLHPIPPSTENTPPEQAPAIYSAHWKKMASIRGEAENLLSTTTNPTDKEWLRSLIECTKIMLSLRKHTFDYTDIVYIYRIRPNNSLWLNSVDKIKTSMSLLGQTSLTAVHLYSIHDDSMENDLQIVRSCF